MPVNILVDLGGDRAEQSELEQVLQEYFGLASHPSTESILYTKRNGEPALKITYDQNGLLVGAEPAGDLQTDEIAAIRRKVEEQLLTPGPTKVRRRVLFTALPARGWFRYGDKFQIVPVPAEAPRPRFLIGAHPFLLEFRFPSSNLVISHQRQDRVGREWELVCSTLLAWRVWSIGPQTNFNWSIDIDPAGIPQSSQFLQEGYTWPGYVAETDNFSPTEGYPVLASLDPNEYYSLRGISPDQGLDIPDDLTILLDKFSVLTREDRDRFLRASYWFQHARTVFSLSTSAAITALVSAVEALSAGRQSASRCRECGQLVGPGPTQMFPDFIEAHLPGTQIPDGERKRFYRLRSALSHGGKLLLRDHTAWGFTPQSISEDNDMRKLSQIVQAVLHNWLVMRM